MTVFLFVVMTGLGSAASYAKVVEPATDLYIYETGWDAQVRGCAAALPRHVAVSFRGVLVECTVTRGTKSGDCLTFAAPKEESGNGRVRAYRVDVMPSGEHACKVGPMVGDVTRSPMVAEPRFRPTERTADAVTWARMAKADYLMVAPRAWLGALQPLKKHRETLGHVVALVAVESIYTAHSNGVPEAAGLSAFVARLRTHTKGKLRFVLLAGHVDANTTVLPVATHWAQKLSYGRQYWNDDDQYPTDLPTAMAGGDALAVGRIPARTLDELSVVVSKIVRYETAAADGEWRRRLAVFTGPARYGKVIDTVVESLGGHLLDNMVPYDYDLRFLFAKPDQTYAYPPTRLTERLTGVLSSGALIAGYVGHGNIDTFDGVYFRHHRYPIGTVEQAETFKAKDGGHPFFVSLACLTGAYDLAPQRSIGVGMAMNPNGAIAVVAGSRVVHPYANALYAQSFITSYMKERPETIGEGMLAMKRRARDFRNPLVEAWLKTDGEALMVEHDGLYNLFGDPATRLRYPDALSVKTAAEPKPGAELTVTIASDVVKSGELVVTLETQRSVVRGQLVPWRLIEKLETADALATMASNYERATETVVSTHHAALRGGVAVVKVPAPRVNGKYVVKAWLAGGGTAGAGHAPLTIAGGVDATCRPIPQVRQAVRGLKQPAKTRRVHVDLDAKGSPVFAVPAYAGRSRESMRWDLWIDRGPCPERLGSFRGMGTPRLAALADTADPLRAFMVDEEQPGGGVTAVQYRFQAPAYTPRIP